MSLFSSRTTKEEDLKLAKKANSRRELAVASFKMTGDSLLNKIKSINATVAREFKGQEDNYRLILTEEELAYYIDEANKVGEFALDTETSGLDTLICSLAGVCLYVPGLIPAYAPANHVNYVTGVRIKEQLSNEIIRRQFERLDKNTGIIWHNAKSDIRVLLNTLGINMFKFTKWDTMIGSCLLNENEEHGLKYLHETYCGGGGSKYTELFKDVPFTHIPLQAAYFYGSKDPKMTYELYQFQKPYLDYNNPVCKERGLVELAKMYEDIEIPLIGALVEMEQAGVTIDKEYANNLLNNFSEITDECEDNFYKACKPFEQDIKRYRLSHGLHCRLENPIRISSPDQIAILLYDIIKVESVDKRNERGTGEPILEKLKETNKIVKPIVEALIEYRKVVKLVSTYVKKLPKAVNTNTGKLHTSFNQHVTVTGRLSSSNPNLQNIPARGKLGKLVRLMFVAGKNNYLLSGDYSQQEPLVLADRSGEEKLKQIAGRDVYAFFGQYAFNCRYEDCLEKHADGTLNPEGKWRRNNMKTIILGIMYERGAASIAAQLGVETKEAQKIIDKFFETFPGIKIFRDKTLQMAKDYGYVEMICGRKRRLPDMMLPQYDFSRYGEGSNFDPVAGLDGDEDESIREFSNEVDEETQEIYTKALNRAWGWKQKQSIIAQAGDEGIRIDDNSTKISTATRQCVNSVIQGSSGIITKNAMVKFKARDAYELPNRREEFYTKLEPYLESADTIKKTGAKLILQVHDELMTEVNKKYIVEAKEALKDIMIRSAADLISVPLKVDMEIVEQWSGEGIDV